MAVDSTETINELLNVAERLFAAEGVEQVALTRIVSVSGKKNRSALHYHFGSREAVVAAVLDRRLAHINQTRHRLLDELEGTEGDLWALMEAHVAALALVVVDEPWGADYVKILAQVTFRPHLLGDLGVSDANVSSVRRFRRLMEKSLPNIPRVALSARRRWFGDTIVHGLARWTYRTPRSRQTRENIQTLIVGLVDYGVAGISVRPSDAARVQHPSLRTPGKVMRREE